MTRRPRKHIPIIEIAASALADKLHERDRAWYRHNQLPARDVIRLFTPDHIDLHAWGGVDRWWNLDMRLRGSELKAKDRADTSRAAKVRRLDNKWRDFLRRTVAGIKPLKRESRWPKRKMR